MDLLSMEEVKHFNEWNFLSRSLTAPIDMEVL